MPNSAGVLSDKAEDSSVCTCEGAGAYVKEVCTSRNDAVCEPCTACGDLGGEQAKRASLEEDENTS